MNRTSLTCARVSNLRQGVKLLCPASSTIHARETEGSNEMASSNDLGDGAEHRLIERIQSTAESRDLGGFTNAITECYVQKVIRKVAALPTFWPSVRAMVESIDGDRDEAVMLGLAEVGRLSQLKAKNSPLPRIANDLLARSNVLSFSLGRDGDKRYYAALGWRCSGRPVDPVVAARTATFEEKKEQARREWLKLLFSACSVAEGVDHLTGALDEIIREGGSESPSSRSSRLQRLMQAIRAVLDPDVFALDANSVSALTRFVERAFFGLARPDQYGNAAKAVDELSLLLLHLIRMDLHLLTEPATYSAIEGASRWLPEGGWLRLTGSSAAINRLRRTLLQGLVILLKQRNPNQALVDCHRKLCRSSGDASTELKTTADAHPDMPADMRSWLSTGGKAAFDAAEATTTDSDDQYIARALLSARALNRCTILSTEHADASVNELIERSRELENRVALLAKRRNLEAFGTIGETIRFRPHAHHLTRQDAAPDKVELVAEGVERRANVSQVVVPAIVRPRA